MKRPATLSARFVETVNRPGRYGTGAADMDFRSLLKRMTNGRLSKSWSQRIRIAGIPNNIGLGAYPVITLAAARKAALANRRAIAEGRNPLERKARIPTFAQAAEIVMPFMLKPGRTVASRLHSGHASLRDYAMPRLGKKSVAAITSADVLSVLTPIWNTKRETARRVRQRISAIMKWAIAEGHRDDNPAGQPSVRHCQRTDRIASTSVHCPTGM